jgi:cysteine desulfurase
MGVAPDLARGAVRVSFGPDNDAQQVRDLAAAVAATAGRLRRLTAMAV